MANETYELIALTMRYVFTLLMLIIVFRATRNTVIDNRRAAKLRRLSPMTGVTGELLVLDGTGSTRTGTRYTIIREGVIGSSKSADIRIRHKSVHRKHVVFQLAEDGLHVRAHAGARIRDKHGRPHGEMILHDGSVFRVGNIHLMLVLSMPEGDGLTVHAKRREETENDNRPAPHDEINLFDIADRDGTVYPAEQVPDLANAFGRASRPERRRPHAHRRPERQRNNIDDLFDV